MLQLIKLQAIKKNYTKLIKTIDVIVIIFSMQAIILKHTICSRTFIHTYVHTYIHTYMHTYIRTYVHTYVQKHTKIHTLIHIGTHTNTCIYTHIYSDTQAQTQTRTRTVARTYGHLIKHARTDGEVTRESGTSASSPVFGAMVTLWNDMRLGKHCTITYAEFSTCIFF